MTDPTAIVDYSRPVGWWCPVCCTADGYVGRLIRRKPRERKQKHYCLDDEGNRLRKTPIASCIPRYLEIPEGQRPPAASEVEDAEVVTWDSLTFAWYSRPDRHRRIWVVAANEDAARAINYIVTGATE